MKQIIIGLFIMLLVACSEPPTYVIINRSTDAINADIVYSTQSLDDAMARAELLFNTETTAFTAVGIAPCRREGMITDYLYVCSDILYRRSR